MIRGLLLEFRMRWNMHRALRHDALSERHHRALSNDLEAIRSWLLCRNEKGAK